MDKISPNLNGAGVCTSHGGFSEALVTLRPDPFKPDDDGTDAAASLQNQIAYLERILGFSYHSLKNSQLTIKQHVHGNTRSADILVKVRPVKGDSEREVPLVFKERLYDTSCKRTAASSQILNTISAPTIESTALTDSAIQETAIIARSRKTLKDNYATRQSSPKKFDRFHPPARSGRPALSFQEAPATLLLHSSPLDVHPPRALDSVSTTQTKAERRERALGLKRKTADRSHYYKKKPRYRTWCMKDFANGCDRATCKFAHGDQRDYFGRDEYISDNRPWRNEAPEVESWSDLEHAPGHLPKKRNIRRQCIRKKRKFLLGT